jgi:mannose-1-phosphate guanylyltransferase
MNNKHIIICILCGGTGFRLWPLSTEQTPKQFITLGNKGTLLEETLRRINILSQRLKEYNYIVYDPLLLMNKNHKLPPELSLYEQYVIYEEYANDTAAAILKMAIAVKAKYSNNIEMLILPADHYIYNINNFVTDIINGTNYLTLNNIVLYGINPTGPETKYGYIIPHENHVTFKEKPDIEYAKELIKQNALWNAGIFLAHTNLLISCLEKSSYNINDWIVNPREGKSVSFDIAVLQQYPYIYAHHSKDWMWDDIGTFNTFLELPDIKNAIKEDITTIKHTCKNVIVVNKNNKNIVTIGCENLYIISDKDNLLIMNNTIDYSNILKSIVSTF